MKKDIITIAGVLGSGKSTIAKILQEKLGYEYYYAGGIYRSLAEKYHMTVIEFNEFCKKDKKYDNELDQYIEKLAEEKDHLIIDSRLAWHFAKSSFKVYVTVEVEEAARRIYQDDKRLNEDKYNSVEEAKEGIFKRRQSETQRYMAHYGLDMHKMENYDLIVDTTNKTPEEAANIILESFRQWREQI